MEKLEQTLDPECNAALRYRGSPQLVNDLRDDACNAVDGDISMNVKVLEADLFEEVRQLDRVKH